MKYLQLKVKSSSVPNFFYFTIDDYLKKRKSFFLKIKENFKGELVAIRSSSAQEDSSTSSSAGKFESVLNVPSNDYEMVSKAIEKVIKSFEINEKSNLDQIIIEK